MAPLNPANSESDRGGNQQASIPEQKVDPNPHPRDGGENGDLMMSAEKGDAQEHAGERRVGDGPQAAGCAQLEQEDQRNPDGAVHHHGPGRVAHEAGEAEDDAAGQAGAARTPEAAAEEIAEAGRHQVNRHVIPCQRPARDVAVFQRQQEENPVQRIGGARYRLSEERLAGPEVGIPEREAAGVPLLRLHVEPGQDLLGKIGARHPLELAGEGELPIVAGDRQKQQGGDENAVT